MQAAGAPLLGGSAGSIEGLAAWRVAQAAAAASGLSGGSGEHGAQGASGSGGSMGRGALGCDPQRMRERPASAGGTAGLGWRTSVRVTLH